MATVSTSGLMTADELAAMPDDGRYQYELVRGKLIRMSPSFSGPAIVATNIGFEIGPFVRQHRLGVCSGADWGFLLASNPDTVRSPDFSFVRADRVPAAGVPRGFWPGAPDLAVEVLSASNRPGQVRRKVRDYLKAGTRLVWVVDPERRTATVYRRDVSSERVDADGVLDGEDVLPGFRLALREVWI